MTGNIVQSTYGFTMPAGAAGAFASTSGWDADTKQAEGNIGFGLVVSKGDADDGAVLGGGLYIGISVRDITLVHTTADRYEAGDNMSVAVRGDIWVLAEDAVEANQQVLYNTSTGALGSDGGTAIAGAKWLTTTGVGELGKIRLSNAAGDVTT